MTALETVLADIRQRGIDLIYNLGDLVGKGSRSDLAIDRCREVCAVTVRGNWDEGIARLGETDAASLWYKNQIGQERIDYLGTLPNCHDFWLSGKRVRLFHASQANVYTRIHAWQPYETHRAMFTNTDFTGFDQPEPDIVGYGDIHLTYMVTLYDHQKILFNAGSVGNALDMPLATYVVLTGKFDSHQTDLFSMDFVRLPYDIEAEIEQARQVGVPDVEAYAVELRTAIYRGRQKQQAG